MINKYYNHTFEQYNTSASVVDNLNDSESLSFNYYLQDFPASQRKFSFCYFVHCISIAYKSPRFSCVPLCLQLVLDSLPNHTAAVFYPLISVNFVLYAIFRVRAQ